MKFDQEFKFHHMTISPDDKYILASSKKELICIFVEDPMNPVLIYNTNIGFKAMSTQFNTDCEWAISGGTTKEISVFEYYPAYK